MPQITLGTFNLNNLFSRLNFQSALTSAPPIDSVLSIDLSHAEYRLRTYKGRLVKAKKAKDTKRIAERMIEIDLDILAVQEVEDIDELKRFVSENLGGLYPHAMLIEGNDLRLIDVALLSKYPIGAVTSWQTSVHPDDPGQRVFSRDLLEVEILNESRSRRLLTVYNTHLKSKYVDWRLSPAEKTKERKAANERRRRQAEMAISISQSRQRPNSRYAIVGDMNDSPGSPPLKPFRDASNSALINALKNPSEIGPSPALSPPPQSTAWTHRHKETGETPVYELYDQIWLSEALAQRRLGAWIHRRKNATGYGSDHDPAWITLDL